MTDKYQINYHKLMYHPERIAQWLSSKNSWEKVKQFYPLYVEISLSSDCNHRCKFCAIDYLKYTGDLTDSESLKKTIKQMAKLGVKSVNFSGEGEPLVHPQADEIIIAAAKTGIDVSITTNGTYLTEKLLETVLPITKWIKVSIDAGTAETHQRLHRPKTDDFEVILKNLEKAVEIRHKNKLDCTLGGQMILLPDNWNEAEILAQKLKKNGIDYLVIKTYNHHPKSKTEEYKNISYDNYLSLKAGLEKFNDDSFKIIFRERSMNRTKTKRRYQACLATPFFLAYLMANGDIYGCCHFLGDERFKLGNYNQLPFKKIWQGEARKKLWQLMKSSSKFDFNDCIENCRMEEVNQYLERLNNPPDHKNFI